MEPSTLNSSPKMEVMPSDPERRTRSIQRKNIYPVVRHIFLVISIICAISIIIFLMYQNGKVIYDNGL